VPDARLDGRRDQAADRAFRDVAKRPAGLPDDDRIGLVRQLGLDGLQLGRCPLVVGRRQLELRQVLREGGHETSVIPGA